MSPPGFRFSILNEKFSNLGAHPALLHGEDFTPIKSCRVVKRMLGSEGKRAYFNKALRQFVSPCGSPVHIPNHRFFE